MQANTNEERNVETTVYTDEVEPDQVATLPPDGPDLAANSEQPVDHEEHIGEPIEPVDDPAGDYYAPPEQSSQES